MQSTVFNGYILDSHGARVPYTLTLAVDVTPAASAPVLGLNHGAWLAAEQAGVTAPAMIFYNPPAAGVPQGWPGPAGGAFPVQVTAPAVEFKPPIDHVLAGQLDGALRSYFARTPPGALVTAWAEGDGQRYPYTPAQIRALHARLLMLFRQVAPATAMYGQVLAQYTSLPASAHYPLSQWVAPGLDFYGLDAYKNGPEVTPAQVFEPMLTQLRSVTAGGRLAVFETNAPAAADRPGWLEGAWQWATDHDCLLMAGFFDTGYPWQAGDSATIAELARLAGESAAGY